MEMDRYNGQGKRYYVTDHAFRSPGERRANGPYSYGPQRYGTARQWKYGRSVDGERRMAGNAYDIAEGTCRMADIEFDADGTVVSVRYDLVRPVWESARTGQRSVF